MASLLLVLLLATTTYCVGASGTLRSGDSSSSYPSLTILSHFFDLNYLEVVLLADKDSLLSLDVG